MTALPTPNIHAPLEAQMAEMAQRVESLEKRVAALEAQSKCPQPTVQPLTPAQLAMYATDEYPRKELTLTVTLCRGEAATITVSHPANPVPIETYFCKDDAATLKTMAMWMARHPAEVRG